VSTKPGQLHSRDFGFYENLRSTRRGIDGVEIVPREDEARHLWPRCQRLVAASFGEKTDEVVKEIALAILVVSLVCHTLYEVDVKQPHGTEKALFSVGPSRPPSLLSFFEEPTQRQAARTCEDLSTKWPWH
jgi:hypothetical protein